MTQDERKALIARYKNGYQEVIDALAGISPNEMDFRIASDKWSCREIVHHLADSETTSGYRLRKLLTEFNPYIQGYDEADYAKKLKYSTRPFEPALEAFKAARETTAQLFEIMSEADWKRAGEHSESGPYSVEKWLQIYSVHAHTHADQIRRNRKKFQEGSKAR
jgi:hypothetical protein